MLHNVAHSFVIVGSVKSVPCAAVIKVNILNFVAFLRDDKDIRGDMTRELIVLF